MTGPTERWASRRFALEAPWTRRLLLAFLLLAVVLPAAAAISFRAANTAENSGATVTLTKPAGTAQDDLLLAVLDVRDGTASSITPPAGWTLERRTDDGTTMSQYVYRKVAGASEGASYAFTIDTTRVTSAAIAAYSGVDATTPIDLSGGQSNGASTSVTAGAITTTVANTMVVGLFGTATQSSFTAPGGMSERADVASTGGLLPLDRSTTELADVAQAAAGSTGSKTATAADSAANIGQLIALRPPSVAFSSASSSGSEATGSVNLAVSLSGASSLATTVDYSVTGGSATGGGTDFTLASGTLTFPAGTTSQNVAVTVAGDTLDELDETLVVTLATPSNANLGAQTTHTYTINDDDAPPTVTLGLAGSPMAESAGGSTVTATLSAASGLTVTVNLAFAGTATLTDDYTRSGTSISVGPGSTSGSVTLTAVQDALDEAAETVVVDIDTVTNGAESGTQQVTASIADDDPQPTVTLGLSGSPGAEAAGVATVTATLSAASGLDVTVNLAFAGTATLTDDYTRSGTSISILAGATSGSVTLTAVQDALDEAAETVVVDIDTVTNGAESGAQQVTSSITDDDPSPTVTLGLSGSPAAEAAGVATVTATLSAASGLDVIVNLAFAGTATLTDDYARSAASISILAGATTGSVTLTAVQDALDEAAETVVVDIDTVTNGAESGSQQVTASITDDDPQPTVTLGLSGSPAAEAAGVATVTATLSAASGLDVTVNLVFAGTGTLTDDYTRSGTSISILAGATSGSVTLTAVQDALDEAAETVVVDIDTVTNGAESGTQQVTASIADDDPQPTVTLGLSGSPAAEAAGVATVTAALSAASGLDVTVNFAFAGTATLTSDYTRSGASISILAGATSGAVTLTAVQDTADEPAETVIVDIDTVTNGAESGSQQVTASITDDDAAPSVTLGLSGSPAAEAAGVATVTATLSAASGFDVTANLAFAGTATLTSDYTRSGASISILAGATTGSVTLTAVQDALDEAAETVIVDIDTVTNGAESGSQQVTASITDDDPVPDVTLGLSGSPMAEAAGTATVTATLSAASSLDVTVNLAFGGTATLTDDYTRSGASITITAGGTSGTVTLTAVQDGAVEAAETIIVDVDTVTNGAESGSQQVVATVADDDVPGFTIVQSGGSSSVAEAAGTDSFTVVLTLMPTSNVVLSVTSADLGEATAGPATLTFTNGDWNVPQTVTLTGVADAVDDGDQSTGVTVSVVDASSADEYDVVADQTVPVATVDDDAAGFTVVESGGATAVDETGATDTFTVVLASEPTSDVVLSVASGDLGEATVAPATLTFTAANWNVAQTVTATGVQDNVADGAQSAAVTLAVVDASSAAEYDPLADATVTVSVPDSGVVGGGEGGGGGGSSPPSSSSGAEHAVAGYPLSSADASQTMFASSIFYAPADSRVEIVLPDAVIPNVVLDLDGDLERADFHLTRTASPPPTAPLPGGVTAVLALQLDLSDEEALAAATLQLSLDPAEAREGDGLVWAYWDGVAWEPLHAVPLVCEARCTGQLVTTHFSLFALLRDDEAPTLAWDLGAELPAGARLVADAADNLGELRRVDFFVDGELLATDDAAPFEFWLPADLAGPHEVRAAAWDIAGNSALVERWVELVAEDSRRDSSSHDDGDRDGAASAPWPVELLIGAVVVAAIVVALGGWGVGAVVVRRRSARWHDHVKEGESSAEAGAQASAFDGQPIPVFTHREELTAKPRAGDDVAAMLRRELRR